MLWLLRRQRSVVAACILIGALVPTVAMLWRPTSYSSTSLVLVSTPAGSGSSGGSSAGSSTSNTNITDSAIAESSAVLAAAAAKVAPHVTLQEAQKRVSAAPLPRTSCRSGQRDPLLVPPRRWPTPLRISSSASSRRLMWQMDQVPSGARGASCSADHASEQVRPGDPTRTGRDPLVQHEPIPRRVGHPALGLVDHRPIERVPAASERQQPDRRREAQRRSHEWWDRGHSERVVGGRSFANEPTAPDCLWCRSRPPDRRCVRRRPATEDQPHDPRRDCHGRRRSCRALPLSSI